VVWFRHGVDVWHHDCEVANEKHDFLVSVTRKGEGLELCIPRSNMSKNFRATDELNSFLRLVGLET
jgi:hypothetical protein